ncbi:hypothetical protein B7R54_01090 [Subtercola boreus]|uniref:ANTAR domain-containing protein n=1 Tax=Subtercola boreus TaxID=120213 RepID=A0A3E0VDH3_9MICO|nr:GAF and ANTAR domain-containing protein [Subtercola boreus]RFA07964.1 hypothetical protein B7R54_01090 [Subtercola boreus]TQL55171.1 GAF domain-containing protein [Subtercola boreus]
MADNEITTDEQHDESSPVSDTSRETLLSAAFVKLADTLVDDFDIVDLLHTLVDECRRILNIEAAGLMLANQDEQLELVASTSEEAELVEIMQINAGAGPCVDAYTGGDAVAVADIAAEQEHWPAFSSAALALGFHAVYATPMKLRGRVIGTLNLLSTSVGVLEERDANAARALADAATIAILQERLLHETTIVTEQLNHALESRIFIEQAKGALAQTFSVSMDEAFQLLRNYARRNNLRLQVVAAGIADRSIAAAELATPA